MRHKESNQTLSVRRISRTYRLRCGSVVFEANSVDPDQTVILRAV